MNALRDAFQATSDEVTAKGVPDELPLDAPMSFKQARPPACAPGWGAGRGLARRAALV